MHVEDLKRWHWVAFSIVVGLALSWVWSSVEFQENRVTMGQREFEMGLRLGEDKVGGLLDVTVLPPIEGKYTVLASRIAPGQSAGVGLARPVAYTASTPYLAGQWGGEPDRFNNVLEYLKKLKETDPKVKFRYAWWRETWAVYTLWTTASVLLIGGVWPSIVSLMVGAGLGFHKADEGPEYDLDRFKGEPEKAKAPAKNEPTAAQIDQLHQLEDELEKKLKAKELGLPIPDDEPAGVPAAVRKLDGGPLQSVAADKPAEEHEYKGEFYPVDRGAKKKQG
jgi:hypothetical protein